jgi:cellulase (glycosyl hydrolase family 5)
MHKLAVSVLTALTCAIVALLVPVQAHASTNFVPYGITLSGLQRDLRANSANQPAMAMSVNSMSTLRHQIYAVRNQWHSNTVRLQVEQDKLVGTDGRHYSAAYMQNIRGAVNYALAQGLTVVVNDQTEPAPGFSRNESLPTSATTAFWQRISHYYGNSTVVFDLFNEPRHATWNQWRAAMQPVVDSLRHRGINNTLWVEGINYASTLAGVPLLYGGGIAYTIHHPAGAHTVASWEQSFGYLADEGQQVVVGEWTNYQHGYHWQDAAKVVPQFLSFLASKGIGMTAWTLGKGVLDKTDDYRTATTEPTGAGWMIRNWFQSASYR